MNGLVTNLRVVDVAEKSHGAFVHEDCVVVPCCYPVELPRIPRDRLRRRYRKQLPFSKRDQLYNIIDRCWKFAVIGNTKYVYECISVGDWIIIILFMLGIMEIGV